MAEIIVALVRTLVKDLLLKSSIIGSKYKNNAKGFSIAIKLIITVDI